MLLVYFHMYYPKLLTPKEETSKDLQIGKKSQSTQLNPVKEHGVKSTTFQRFLRTFKMVRVPAGSFFMGSPPSKQTAGGDERPLHKVTISKDFYMGKYEVSQALYESIMHQNPSHFRGKNLPVENLSWYDVQKFLIQLNIKVGCTKPDVISLIYKSGLEAVPLGCFRLPTEAEWEYSARAGSQSEYHFGQTLNSDQANFDGTYPYKNSKKGIFRNTSTKIGTFQANAFGLYDMHGNVSEWCLDGYNNGFYYLSPAVDPVNVSKATGRVIRGGCWSAIGKGIRSAYRSTYKPNLKLDVIGFRLVAVLEASTE